MTVKFRFASLQAALVAILLSAGIALGGPQTASAATPLPTTFGANAAIYNQHSGVVLGGGQTVTISATGTWDICGGHCPTNANGTQGDFSADYVGQQAGPARSLIGSFDGGATYFFIGTGPTVVTAPAAGGELITTVVDYDWGYYDNTGVLQVTVAGGQAASTTTVSFGPGPFVYTGAAFTATATVSPSGTATIAYTGDCVNAGNTCTATATYAVDANTLPSSAVASITITAAPRATLTRLAGGDDDDRDRDDEDESRGFSGRYQVGASCGGGTVASALLNGKAVTNGQVVMLKHNPKKTESKKIGRGVLEFRGTTFTLVVTCQDGTSASTVLQRTAPARGGEHDDDRGRGHGDRD